MAEVLIKRGLHAGREHADVQFKLVRGLSAGKTGRFLTVNGAGYDPAFPQRNFRIIVDSEDDFEIMGEDAHLFMNSTQQITIETSSPLLSNYIAPDDSNESDDDIKARINERFDILAEMTQEIARGTIKGLVVYGAPGVGKSFGVEHALERDSIMDKLAYDPTNPNQDAKRVSTVYEAGEYKSTFNPRYKIIKGNITANGLYKTLFDYQDARDVIVFDDTDVVLQDETMLTFLKIALDTTEKRILHWISNSNRSDALPNSFEFKGSVIFITNLNFERVIAAGYAKLSPHLEAILSRCLYLDLTIDTVREKLIRIDHVARDLGMLSKAGLTDDQVNEVLEFTHTFADRFRELSLRKVLQVADLRKMDRNWSRVAELTVLKNAR